MCVCLLIPVSSPFDPQVTGTYTFVDKVGNEVSVNYDADHAGFRARSNSLPQVSVSIR